MRAMASQITGFPIVYSTVCSGPDQRKHQSSASLAFVRGIHRWPVNSPHKWPVTRKMFPFDDVIMFPFQWTYPSSASAIQAVLTPSLVRVDTMSAASGLGWSILKVHVIIVLSADSLFVSLCRDEARSISFWPLHFISLPISLWVKVRDQVDVGDILNYQSSLENAHKNIHVWSGTIRLAFHFINGYGYGYLKIYWRTDENSPPSIYTWISPEIYNSLWHFLHYHVSLYWHAFGLLYLLFVSWHSIFLPEHMSSVRRVESRYHVVGFLDGRSWSYNAAQHGGTHKDRGEKELGEVVPGVTDVVKEALGEQGSELTHC